MLKKVDMKACQVIVYTLRYRGVEKKQEHEEEEEEEKELLH